MSTINRNSLCPCESGRTYKNCCERIQVTQVFGEAAPEVISAYIPMLVRQQRFFREHDNAYGEGRFSQSFILGEDRILVVGGQIYSAPKDYTFHDFLVEYIVEVLGTDWAVAEVEKRPKDRHLLMRWAEPIYAKHHKISAPPGLIIDGDDPPEAHAYLSAAYDLHVISHNTGLQQRLINRLKSVDQFYGAYYELQVAAAFLRAGFHIEYENENDSRSSHHEFTAVYRSTGETYSVECKARFFDFSPYSTLEEALPRAEQVNITRHIQRALAKKALYSRIVFVDVNYPHIEDKKPEWVNAALRNLRGIEERERPSKPYPSAFIFFTNNDCRSFSALDKTVRRISIFLPFKLPAWNQDWNGEMRRNPGIYALLRSLDILKRIPHEFYRLGLTGEAVEGR